MNKEKIEKLLNDMTKLLNDLKNELNSNKEKIPSKRTVLKNMDELFSIEDLRYEFCILQQKGYVDSYGKWNEDHFRKIGNELFPSEESAIDSINNNLETIQKCDPDLYYVICEGRKLYLHDKIKNSYKRLRIGNGKYYIK